MVSEYLGELMKTVKNIVHEVFVRHVHKLSKMAKQTAYKLYEKQNSLYISVFIIIISCVWGVR